MRSAIDRTRDINHALGIYPKLTIDALQTNSYLRDTFIDVEVRTTERPDVTYTGTYLNGRVTYVEAFTEGTLGIPRNVFQLALGTELGGSSEVVQQKWNEEFDENETEIPIFLRRVNVHRALTARSRHPASHSRAKVRAGGCRTARCRVQPQPLRKSY